MRKVILDLCGGTGGWSKFYAEAGYDVCNITLPDQDVRTWKPLFSMRHAGTVQGILAAPPCEHFAGSGAQYWKAKDLDGRTLEGLEIVIACLKIIALCRPKWWALENPVGRLKRWLGDPVMYWQPYEYGDAYTKKTCLWGVFTVPKQNPVEPERVCSQGSWVQKLGGKSEKTKRLRSITPPGFAKAFFEANP